MKKHQKKIVTACHFFFLFFFSTACQTSKIERLQNQLFTLQIRLLQLEKDTGNNFDKTIISGKKVQTQSANIMTKVDEIYSYRQELLGEIDLLKQAINTGELPGQGHHNSPASRLKRLDSRIQNLEDFKTQHASTESRLKDLSKKINDLEKTQIKVLDLLSQLEQKEAKTKTKKRKRAHLKKIDDFKSAFSNKHYLYIAEDAPKLLKNKKGKNFTELKLLYAESLFKLGRIADAALTFNELLDQKNNTMKLPKLRLRMGDCFRLLGDTKAALVYYKELIEQHPTAKETTYAKKYIPRLEKKL